MRSNRAGGNVFSISYPAKLKFHSKQCLQNVSTCEARVCGDIAKHNAAGAVPMGAVEKLSLLSVVIGRYRRDTVNVFNVASHVGAECT